MDSARLRLAAALGVFPYLLVQNLTHSQWLNLPPFFPTEAINFKERVAAKIETDKVAEFPIFAHHYRFEGIDVRPTNFVSLLHLHWIPDVHEFHFACFARTLCRHGSDRINSAVNSEIAYLRFVRNSTERDDGPVLEFKWRIFSQFFFRLRQVAHNESASNLPKLFIFFQSAILLQALRHHPPCGRRNVDPDPLALKL